MGLALVFKPCTRSSILLLLVSISIHSSISFVTSHSKNLLTANLPRYLRTATSFKSSNQYKRSYRGLHIKYHSCSYNFGVFGQLLDRSDSILYKPRFVRTYVTQLRGIPRSDSEFLLEKSRDMSQVSKGKDGKETPQRNASGTNVEGFTTLKPGKDYAYKEDIKKSGFEAIATHASTLDEGLAFLDRVRDHKATHNCWAYKGIDGERCSDDGEPGGTAGRPMLAAIDAAGVTQCFVVVIRYFGGIKLGTGGLARAYQSVALEALRQAEKVQIKPQRLMRISADMNHVGAVYHVVQSTSSAVRVSEDYNDDKVLISVRCDEKDFSDFEQRLVTACRGSIEIEDLGN